MVVGWSSASDALTLRKMCAFAPLPLPCAADECVLEEEKLDACPEERVDGFARGVDDRRPFALKLMFSTHFPTSHFTDSLHLRVEFPIALVDRLQPSR
ncbi:hypothetical protein V1279_001927 [Bradyrhizobium sp. AZCC 1610]